MFSEKSKKMAKRLRELRKQHHLSYDKLVAALQEKYNISISKDSLAAYEAAYESHSRFGSNLKMNAEYILCLADFYGVTTDYLLTNTDDPSVTPAVRDETGLSSDAIYDLSASKGKYGDENNSCFIINSLYETYYGRTVFKHLNRCIFAHVAQIAYDQLDNDTLLDALNKKSTYDSLKERYDWVSSYLSVCPLGEAVAREIMLLRDVKYGQSDPNIDTALLYEYKASTTLSKHCEIYAQEVWTALMKELKVHYKFNV